MELAKIDATLDDGAPKSVAVGKGSCALLRGSCRVDRRRIAGLKLLVDGVEAPITRFTEPRVKGANEQRWWSVVDFPKVNESRMATLELEVRIGLRHRERTSLGAIEIEQGWRAPRLELSPGQFDIDGSVTGALALRPLVAICVATSSPSIAAVERFIGRMSKQSYENWVCIIRDGGSSPEHLAALQKATEKYARVKLHGRAGRDRYWSVEKALIDTPARAPYAVLTALEDPWSDPSTLERLLGGFASGVNAVAGIPGQGPELTNGAEGQVLDLASVSNLLEPGPVAWRRELTNYILPLPPAEQNSRHPEWWMLQVAGALGTVLYQVIPEMEDEVAPKAPDEIQLKPAREARLIADTLTDRILQLRCGAFLTRQAWRRVAAHEKART